MRIFVTLFAVLCITAMGYSQVFDWEWQNPLPQGNNLVKVVALSPTNVLIFGNTSVILRTDNGGSSWSIKHPDTLQRNILSADFVDQNIGYLSGQSGLLMKTVDGGHTWQYLDGSVTVHMNDIDFFDADTGYAVGASGTMIKTTNGGTTWSNVTNPVTVAINTIFIQSPNNVFMATASGTSPRVNRSTDYGATWVEITPGGLTQTVWDIFFISQTHGWVATQNGGRVYRTTDSGTTWAETQVDPLIVPNTVKFKDTQTGFVTNNNNGNVYKSTDGGATWAPIAATTVRQNGFDFNGSTIWTAGNAGTMTKSTDDGTNYTELHSAVTTQQIRKIHFFNDLFGVAAGGSTSTSLNIGEVSKTTNGGTTWEVLPFNFGRIVYAFAAPTENIWYAATGVNKIFKTTDGGVTWVEQTSPLPGTTALWSMAFADVNTGYIGGASGSLIKTTDGGTTWTQITNSGFPSNQTIFDIGLQPDGSVTIVGGSATAIKSTDGGTTWTPMFVGAAGTYFAIKYKDQNIGFIGAGSKNLARTTDGGATWVLCNLPDQIASSASFWSFGFGFPNYVWTGAVGGEVLYSADGGVNWVVAKPLSSSTVYDMAVVGNDLWLSGNNGLLVKGFSDPSIPVELTAFSAANLNGTVVLNWSTATETNNSGFEIERKSAKSNWKNIGFITGNGTTTEPQAYSFGDKSPAAGVSYYRLKQIDFDGTFEYSREIEVSVGIPTVFAVEQNYPNPFNPSTVINYQIPTSEFVSLKIFNVIGKEVATLINKVQPAGEYSITFDADNLPSGLYLYRLEAGKYSKTMKMMLIK